MLEFLMDEARSPSPAMKALLIQTEIWRVHKITAESVHSTVKIRKKVHPTNITNMTAKA